MKHRFVSYGIVVVALAGVLSLLLVSMPAAQHGAAEDDPESKPTPRLSNGRPDFSGYYGNSDHFQGDVVEELPGQHIINRLEGGSIFYNYAGANTPQLGAVAQKPNQPPYKPEYMAKVQAIADGMYGGNTTEDPQYDCKPHGTVRIGLGHVQIVHRPDVMAVMYEKSPGTDFRLIYTDGRKHPENLDTSFMGHSIGHWEGDTLVVDVVGLNDETWLGGSQNGNQKFTSIHSDQLHVVERWTRKGDKITVETTVEEPVMFTRPWVREPKTAQIAPAWDYIQPYMCVDNAKEHTIKPSADDQYLCGWCNPEAIYGVEGSDRVTTGEVPEALKDAVRSQAARDKQ
jgi:hypothetical protein